MNDITTLKPTGDEFFADPKVLPLYDDGIIKMDGTGQVFVQGYAVQPWFWTRLTFKQLDYLRDTFCSGGLSGNVTVLVNVGGDASLTRMNAVLVLPKPSELKGFPWYQGVTVKFTRLRTTS
jgi:hypothetical protein